MITIGEVNRLTFEAKGYKVQDCYSEWDDFLILDIIYYSGDEVAFQFDFPYIMAKEFAGIAEIMRDFIASGEERTTIDFTEPNMVFTLQMIEEDKYRVTAEIYMRSYKDGNTIVKNQWFNKTSLNEFIDSIENESRKFPPRF